jgi:hypothetical protein
MVNSLEDLQSTEHTTMFCPAFQTAVSRSPFVPQVVDLRL